MMTAKIIQLADYRRSGITCKPLGVIFPQVYRLQGVTWEFGDKGGLVPGTDPYTEYTLIADPDDTHLANIVHTPIDHLSPGLDQGWVIVRHHGDRAHLDGYLDAVGDMEPDRFSTTRVVYEVEKHFFSIISRPAIEGCPDHLLIYAATIPLALGSNWTFVVNSEGKQVGEDVLFPPDELA